MCYYNTHMSLGQIYKIHSDFYYVYDGTQSFECKVREVLKKQKERMENNNDSNFVEDEQIPGIGPGKRAPIPGKKLS